jgi:hypothetical protein
MAGVLMLNVLDTARALGSEPTRATKYSVADWLLNEYLRKSGGGFNYNPSINWTYPLFEGACTADQAILGCLTSGNPKGRRQNAEAIEKIAAYALTNVSKCYRIGFTAVVVGRVKGENIYVGIKAPMVRVRDKRAFVVMPGFRMSHRPDETEINVACSVALANFARDDFERADFEYLYAGPGLSGEREFRVIHGSHRKIFDRDAVDSLLDTYVNGVALAIEYGAEIKRPDLRGYRIIDPREPSMF